MIKLQRPAERCFLGDINDLRDFACDVRIIINKTNEFQSQRIVLAAASPYFKAMLKTDCKEANERVVNLEADGLVFQAIMDYVYTGQCEVDESKVWQLVQCAHMYQFGDLLEVVEQHLCESQLKKNSCMPLGMMELIFYLEYTGRYNLTKLNQVIVEMILPRIGDLYSLAAHDEASVASLTVDQMRMILSQSENLDCSEALLFYIIKAWYKNNEAQTEGVRELISCIRFVYISKSKRQKIIEQEPLLSKNMDVIGNSFVNDDGMLEPRGKEFDTKTAKVGDKVTLVNNYLAVKSACRNADLHFGDASAQLLGKTLEVCGVSEQSVTLKTQKKTCAVIMFPPSVLMTEL